MRLVESSVPGAVDADRARWLLDERWVLATAVCHALERSTSYADRKPRAALDLLRRWVGARYEKKVETHPKDGLDTMTVPEGYETTMRELRAATVVAESLAMLWTADTQGEYRSDTEQITRDLAAWREVLANTST